MMQPNNSWVARWQSICARALPAAHALRGAPLTAGSSLASPAANYVPGCYALRVKGDLPPNHIATLEDNGIRYRPLDDNQG